MDSRVGKSSGSLSLASAWKAACMGHTMSLRNSSVQAIRDLAPSCLAKPALRPSARSQRLSSRTASAQTGSAFSIAEYKGSILSCRSFDSQLLVDWVPAPGGPPAADTAACIAAAMASTEMPTVAKPCETASPFKPGFLPAPPREGASCIIGRLRPEKKCHTSKPPSVLAPAPLQSAATHPKGLLLQLRPSEAPTKLQRAGIDTAANNSASPLAFPNGATKAGTRHKSTPLATPASRTSEASSSNTKRSTGLFHGALATPTKAS
mmetsp:Transcript_30129/g.76123  ORF Transcript_30129/g.76123 Transcript_30129/m.76123 type:complete len:264 (-) Transcript_30129:1788-2579(-)